MDLAYHTNTDLDVVSDTGAGRAVITVIDDTRYLEIAQAIASAIAGRARAIVVRSAPLTSNSWQVQVVAFNHLLSQLNIRQASFVGIAAGSTLVQSVALELPKIVRSLVIVDASLRPHPTLFERFLDASEAKLPFGLPLRLGSKSFNIRAFAHRLRCPMLLVSTHRATTFVLRELRELGRIAPTAWYRALASVEPKAEVAELCDLVLAFQETPAKCPQKNL